MPPSSASDRPTDPDSSTYRNRLLLRIGRWALGLGASVTSTYLGVCFAAVLVYSVAFPPVTGVQVQRGVQSLVLGVSHDRQYKPVPLSQIARPLPLAVVAGEDSRFFAHGGIDWSAIGEAMEDAWTKGRLRGGSTITQQLVKNLFLTTHPTPVRKALEVPLTYGTELLLSKQRILELYLNVVEWGPGIYGVQAAAEYHFGTNVQSVTRWQAAGLAASLPNPRVRRPESAGYDRTRILRRMNILDPLPLPSAGPTQRSRPTAASPDTAERTPSPDTARPDSPVAGALSDSVSRADSLIQSDTLPPADSLPQADTLAPTDSVPAVDSVPGTDTVSSSDTVRDLPSDSLRPNREPVQDSAGTR